jgi:ribose 5-phosphate isomerase B
MYTGPLYICADHAGYQLKKRLVRYLENELNLEVTDLGPHEYDDQDDFPDFVLPAAEKTVVQQGRLIACCGSGAGEVMAANKVKGMRMTIGYNVEAAELSITHNNANGLALASRVLSDDHAMAIVKKWLDTTDFFGGKYQRRNEKIKEYEQKKSLAG